MYDVEYLDYRRRGELNLLGHAASLAYYWDSPHIFTADINGDQRKYPLFAPEAWRGLDTLPRIEPTSDDSFVQHEDEHLNSRAALSKYMDGEEPEGARMEDVGWNGDVVALNLELGSASVSTVESDYFTKLSIEQGLLTELFSELYTREVPTDASVSDLRDVVDKLALPNRAATGATLEDALERPIFAGSMLLTVFNTGDDHVAVLGKRSETSIETPGVWSVVPAGVFSPENVVDDAIRDQHLTEYGEELFNIEEESGEALDSEAVSRLRAHLEDGGAHFDHLGTTIETRRLSLDFNGLLYVENPTYYQEFVADNLERNYEHSDFELVSLADAGRLDELLTLGGLKPYDSFCVAAGLERLAEEYDVPVALSIDTK